MAQKSSIGPDAFRVAKDEVLKLLDLIEEVRWEVIDSVTEEGSFISDDIYMAQEVSKKRFSVLVEQIKKSDLALKNCRDELIRANVDHPLEDRFESTVGLYHDIPKKIAGTFSMILREIASGDYDNHRNWCIDLFGEMIPNSTNGVDFLRRFTQEIGGLSNLARLRIERECARAQNKFHPEQVVGGQLDIQAGQEISVDESHRSSSPCLINDEDPEAHQYKDEDGITWCTAGYAEAMYKITHQQLSRARKPRGVYKIHVNFREIFSKSRGSVYVHRRIDLEALANAIDIHRSGE